MHQSHIGRWQHQHTFNTDKKDIEKRTLIVVILTMVTMVAEIVVGWLTHSMALFADGWHMGTHAFALGISFFAYRFSRRYAQDRRFTFGTWKIEILGAYSSAVVLGIVGLIMAYASVERLIRPLPILYDQALLVACIGLVVNILSAFILINRPTTHTHTHETGSHDHHHAAREDGDLNLKSAYLHILADAMTSVLAIIALFAAKFFSWNYLDPLMGLAATLLILRWSYTLLKETSAILLDHESEGSLSGDIRKELESDGDTTISDLHLWKVADRKYACIVSVVSGGNQSTEHYKERLGHISELTHVTVEINRCHHPE